MKHITVAVVVALFTALALYHLQPAQPKPEPFDYLNVNAECTKQLEIECAVDI